MSNFVLAVDPIRPWNTLLPGSNQFNLGGSDDRGLVLNGSVSGPPATIELYGSNSGTRGANLLNGAAQVNVVRYTVAGQVVMRADDALITGPLLAAWLRGDRSAFGQAVFVGDDFIALSNAAERQNGYGGNDVMHGRSGNDTLFGSDGNDTLFGDGGNDTAYGGAGDDHFGGIIGMDTFLIGALKRRTQLAPTPLGQSVPESMGVFLSGPEDVDALAFRERIGFLNGTLHLDPAGAAGQVWRL
ncbi:hypothetical protein GCM10009416_49370 [Craurococcus roseus]|uniref:Calcium-binding protein n=1 Tax=Craurococcus roseus TaxID=77585 RepID=A0ABP3RFH8_9PROT